MTHFQSHQGFSLQAVLDMSGDELKDLMTIEYYNNDDYELLESKVSIEAKDQAQAQVTSPQNEVQCSISKSTNF